MNRCIVDEKGFLRLRVQLAGGLKRGVLHQHLVRGEDQQVAVWRLIEPREIRVVEREPRLRPRLPTCHSNARLSIGSCNVAFTGKSGWIRGTVLDDPTAIFEGSAKRVRSRKGHNVSVVESLPQGTNKHTKPGTKKTVKKDKPSPRVKKHMMACRQSC